MDKLVLSGFIGPYLMSFFVAEFVLLMQFLWKNIDDIIGKGFTILELLELIFYFGLTIIPLSVPITILISSVMVFGNLSERYELSSLKSAGISLMRIMRSAIVLSILTALFSWLASNYLKPKANYQFQYRFKTIERSKPTLLLEEGVFDDDFKGYVIRIGKKEKDGRNISDVLLYDQAFSSRYLANIIKADSGEMYTVEDGNLFVMEMRNGEHLKELEKSTNPNEKDNKYPLMRTYFNEYKKVFDMSQFEVGDSEVNINSNRKDMLNTWQLLDALDSIQIEKEAIKSKLSASFSKSQILPDSLPKQVEDINAKRRLEVDDIVGQYRKLDLSDRTRISQRINKATSKNILIDSVDMTDAVRFIDIIKPEEHKTLLTRAHSAATNHRDMLRARISNINGLDANRSRYLYTLHSQYAWAMACIVFLFIGAPLGSIIRKGGYGYPLLVSIVFYMLLFITSIMGSKLNRNLTLGPYTAAWLPILLLSPFAIFITWKALLDYKSLFNFSLPRILTKRLWQKNTPTTL